MLIKVKKIFFLACCFLLFSFKSVFAALPWLINTNLGYGKFTSVAAENTTSIIRVALAKDLTPLLGAELGVETGKTMIVLPHFPNNPYDLKLTGTVNTFFDLLGRYTIPLRSNLQAIAKAGVSYRSIDFSHQALKEITRVEPEIQLGLGYAINRSAQLEMTYQIILGEKIQITDVSETPQGIPGEQVLFVGFSIAV